MNVSTFRASRNYWPIRTGILVGDQRGRRESRLEDSRIVSLAEVVPITSSSREDREGHHFFIQWIGVERRDSRDTAATEIWVRRFAVVKDCRRIGPGWECRHCVAAYREF